jgi:hypothetical protein
MTTTTTMVTIIMKYFYSTKSTYLLKNMRMKNVHLPRSENQLVANTKINSIAIFLYYVVAY